MKINENVKIIGKNVILIPYEAKHVERYHLWMSNKELQELTASDPLSLEEEYEMQKSWRNDDDKCTFLILDKENYEKTNDEINSLIGDTNLFLLPTDDDDDDDEGDEHNVVNGTKAETEIMIAEPLANGKHFGWESMLLMLKYGVLNLKCKKFIAKIGYTNVKSINMFKKMEFIEQSRSDVFQEITYERRCTDKWINWLNLNVIEYKENKYY